MQTMATKTGDRTGVRMDADVTTAQTLGRVAFGGRIGRIGGQAGVMMPKVYLASKSPRRRLMLSDSGIEHEVIRAGVDDGGLSPGEVTPVGWVAALAYLKARAALHEVQSSHALPGGEMVLGADTIVYKNGRIIGQPADADDARRIIQSIENGGHAVLTGVCLIDLATGRRDFFVDRAQVTVGTIGATRIEEYVASGDWAGKAGAYNLAERLSAGWPIDFDGDPTTIMGLPMAVLPGRLARFAAECSRAA